VSYTHPGATTDPAQWDDLVIPLPPSNLSAPAVDGSLFVGSTLLAQPGEWSGAPSPSLSYQWERCGDGCRPIDGATQQRYLVHTEDQDFALRVRVTASNVGGFTDAVSAQTGVVPALPSNGRIAFNDAAAASGNDDVYVMAADGTGRTRLTTADGPDERPRWSPDGKQIVFQSRRTGDWEVFVMSADGSNQTNLTNSPETQDTSPSFTPDGARIVFAQDGAIKSFPAGGGEASSTGASGGNPAYSPDGLQLAYDSQASGSPDIWVLHADGRNERLTTDVAWDLNPSWSADGTRIYFQHLDGETSRWSVMSVAPDGSNLTTLQANDDEMPAPSPDGKKLLFVEIPADIFVANADGTNATRLVETGTLEFNPAWQPVGGGRDTTPPAVTVTAPKAGSTVHGTITVAADASDDGGINHVDFRYFDGESFHEIGTASKAPYTARFDTTTVPDTAPLGGTIYARAVDNAGNATENGNGITVFNSSEPTGITGAVSLSSDTVEAGASTLDIAKLPLSIALQSKQSTTKITQQPISEVPISEVPISEVPISEVPISEVALKEFGFSLASIASELDDVPLSTLPTTYPGGWPTIQQGTNYDNVPVQDVSLGQLLHSYPKGCNPSSPPADSSSCHPPPPLNGAMGVRQVELRDLDVSRSRLRNLSLLALSLGSALLSHLDPPGGGSALEDWCKVLAGAPIACTDPATLGSQSVMGAALEGAPISEVPISEVPISEVPISEVPISEVPISEVPLTKFATSASPITLQPIAEQNLNASATPGGPTFGSLSLRSILSHGSKLATIPVSDLANPALVVSGGAAGPTLADASAHGDVLAGANLASLGANLDGFTLGDIGFYGDLTIADLVAGLPAGGSGYTLGDLIAVLVGRESVAWEDVAAKTLSRFGTNPQGKLGWHVTFTPQGSGFGDIFVTVDLPPGFRYVDGSATLIRGESTTPLADPSTEGASLTWFVDATLGDSYAIDFSTYAGYLLGPTQGSVHVALGGTDFAADSTAAMTVVDTFENNDDTAHAAPVPANGAVDLSYISSKGDVDFYSIPAPPAGWRITVHMVVPADFDLALLAPAKERLRATSARAPTPQSPPIRDTGLDFSNVNDVLEPAGLRDTPISEVPISEVPVAGQSINRGANEEDVAAISQGTGTYLIKVAGYQGASSTLPYALRVETKPPIVDPVCAPRSLPALPSSSRGAAPVGIPSNANTVFVVDRYRLAQTYGESEAQDVMTSLATLANQPALGVLGVVEPVDANPTIQGLYDTWDENPCSSAASNAVATAIADTIDNVREVAPNLKYVVLVGGYDIVPPFAYPDLTRIANETGYAGTFADNQYYGWLATSHILTDEPYYDVDPVDLGDRQFFLGDLVGGRLVETPAEIVGAAARFVTFDGKLDRSSAFVSGYDFAKDAAQAVADNEQAYLSPPSVRTLINDTWSAADLTAALFPAVGPSTFDTINAHFDHYRTLSAQGNTSGTLDVLSATQLGTHSSTLGGTVWWSIGCHSGLTVSDVVVAGSATPGEDWAQTFGGAQASWVANSGFGLGDTDTVAFSEQLMALFAKNLDGGLPVGQALTKAKQDYYLDRSALSAYDEKSMLEATFYGLPFYGVGVAPTPIGGTPPAPTPTPTTVPGTASPTSTPVASPIVTDPVSGLDSAGFFATPTFTLRHGKHGDYYESGPGGVDAVNYRPVVARVTMPATKPGLRAHSAIIESAQSFEDRNDDGTIKPFDASFVMPTEDLTALSPEPVFGDAAYPSALATVVSTATRSQLNLGTTQFFTDAHPDNAGIGVMRRFTKLGGRVFYNSSTNYRPPTILFTEATKFGSNVGFTVTVCNAVRTTVLFHDVGDPSGNWKNVDLALGAGSDNCTWTGGSPIAAPDSEIEFLVQSCNADGNCASSSNKARYFEALPPSQPTTPPGAGTITIELNGGTSGDYFDGVVSVAATDSAQQVTLKRSVDGAPLVDYVSGTSFSVQDDGLHTVVFQASDGGAALRSFVVDRSGPTISWSAPPDGTKFLIGATAGTVAYACLDSGSGIKSCVGPPSPSPIDTSTVGAKVFTVTATDIAGHSVTETRTYYVRWPFKGFFSPVDNPTTINLIKAGQAVPVKFSLGGNRGLSIFAAGYPRAVTQTCANGATTDLVEQTVTAGSSSLSYDSGNQQYTYVWKTPSTWAAGTCHQLQLKLIDGSLRVANFKAK
jgi:hypothetical protein